MHKTMSLPKIATSVKVDPAYVQTEEVIADLRAIQTPSQRVEEKLAACAGGFARTFSRRDESGYAPRRPR